MGQSDNSSHGSVEIGAGTLYETHAIYSHAIGPGTFTGKALYSRWDIDINASHQKAAGNQYGWYLEPSYRMPTSMGDIGVFGRFSQLDYYKNVEKKYDIWEAGANWWIHQNVVLKANYIHKEDTRNKDNNESGFDIGLGYSF
jgi:hypothetical protein